jgi:tripartite-type tricarboxylate transporter receptor subunit TctC
MKKWFVFALGVCACAIAFAQSPAEPPLVLIVGGPPGNPGDLLLRTLSGPLGTELRQTVIVENKPGAAGTIGLAAVARAKPDGNTLGLLALQSAAAPALIRPMQYDTLRELMPVRQLSWVSNLLVARADSKFRSVDDVVNAGRSTELTFASGGNGTPAHLAAVLFAQETGLQVRHVPFNGAMAAVNAVIGEHVELMFGSGPTVASLIHSGKLRALAAASPERLQIAVAAPTLAESGLAKASMRDWHGLVAPAGTSPQRIDRIALALDKVLATEAVRLRLVTAGLEPVSKSTPATFAALVASEVERWGDLARKSGMKVE